MEEEESSDLSSSSSSYSSEEESVGEEEDEDSDEVAGPRGAERSGEKSERRKRRRKLAGRRRELRSKYESVKDFNPEARSAQTEEIERIRRLELQRSLQGGAPSVSRVAAPPVDGQGELTSLLGSGPVFRNLAEDEEERERVVDAIVISSDSEEEERERVRREGGREVKTEAVEGVKEEKGGRYDVVGEERDNQVVINLGHPPDEEDVTLPPHIARIIKPHQVRMRECFCGNSAR